MRNLAVLILVVAGVSVAAPITRVADSRGCVIASGSFACGASGTGLANFLTGFTGNENGVTPDEERRSFFRFDLTGIAGTVTTAAFELEMPNGGYRSVHTSETIGLFDYLLNPAALTTSPLPGGAFADLGTGTQYGSGVYDLATEGTTVTIQLNAAAVAAINSALGGKFAMGGALTSLASQTSQKELLFALSGNTATSQLVLGFDPVAPGGGVPEPGSAVLMISGLGALAIWGRRRGRV